MLPSDNFISLINIKKEIPDTDDGCDDIIRSSTIANHQTDSLMNIKFESASIKTLNDNGDKIFSGLSFPERFPSDDFVSSINIKKDISDTDDGCDDLTNSTTLANNQIDYLMNIKFESANIPSLNSNGNKIYLEDCFSGTLSSNNFISLINIKKEIPDTDDGCETLISSSTLIDNKTDFLKTIKFESTDIQSLNGNGNEIFSEACFLETSNVKNLAEINQLSKPFIKQESIDFKIETRDISYLPLMTPDLEASLISIKDEKIGKPENFEGCFSNKYSIESQKHHCDICGNSFLSQNKLKQHCKEMHKKIKNHICLECNKVFPFKHSLKRHERLVHLGIIDWKCIHCDKSFISKPNLRFHEHTVHLKNQVLKCLKCEKSFTSKGSLKRHELLIHLKQNWKCEYCDKSYTREENLKQHERLVHLGVQDWKCTFCKKCLSINLV